MNDRNLSSPSGADWADELELDESCSARGSGLCWKFASRGGCMNCYVHNIKESEEKQAACSTWDKTMRMLPCDIDRLSESDTSWFDNGETREPKAGYAVVDMANPEPYTTKGFLFGYGKKVRTPVGSLVTLHIAIGERGMRAFRTVEWLRLGWFIGMTILAIAMLTVPLIAQPMVRLFVMLPVIFLGLMSAAGYAIGKSLAASYMRRHSDEIDFTVSNIPLVAEMLDRGWYFFQSDHGRPRMTFTKKRDFSPLLPPGENNI